MLKRFTLPPMSAAVSRLDAAAVLNGGIVRATGPHICPAPYYIKGKSKMPIKSSSLKIAGAEKTELGLYPAASMIVTPPLPTDIGPNVHDAASAILWTPSTNDVNQWKLDNCYFMAPISGLAYHAPWQLKSILTKNTSGYGGLSSYIVNFRRNAQITRVVVNTQIGSPPDVSGPNTKSGAIGAVLLEKAYAYYRTGANTYASLNWGAASAALSDLGISSVNTNVNATVVIASVASQFPVFCQSLPVVSSGVPIIPNHVMYILGLEMAGDNISNVHLYNPWGVDGFNDDADSEDGIVTLTWQTFAACMSFLTCVNGFPYNHLLGDVNGDGNVDIMDMQAVSNNWQRQVTPWTNGDSNGDGVVDVKDLQNISSEWQQHYDI